ncbi:MAG: hypothetical protein V1714_00695 [Pseudomonadota bacterium]
MNMNKQIIFASFSLLFPIFFIGCSIYGKLVYPSSKGERETIESLIHHSDDYLVYYSGYGEKNPAGILFDPKKDNKGILLSDRWTKIEDRKSMEEIQEWIGIGRYPGYYPALSKILGPDGQFYGYLFTGWSHVVIKGVNADTIYIYDLQDPPQYLGTDGSLRDQE